MRATSTGVGIQPPRRTDATPQTPIHSIDTAGIELSQLWRYLLIGMLIVGCAMLSAWSRIDLRETAVALDLAERQLTSAKATRDRLQLEMATLEDPAWLSASMETLELSNSVPFVLVPPSSRPKAALSN